MIAAEPAMRHGSKFTSRQFIGWCEEQRSALVQIQQGRPMQSGYAESFTGRLRGQCLNPNRACNLNDTQYMIEKWRPEFDTERSYSSLGIGRRRKHEDVL